MMEFNFDFFKISNVSCQRALKLWLLPTQDI